MGAMGISTRESSNIATDFTHANPAMHVGLRSRRRILKSSRLENSTFHGHPAMRLGARRGVRLRSDISFLATSIGSSLHLFASRFVPLSSREAVDAI